MKRILLLTTLALLALVGRNPAHGQAAVEAWVQRYNGPGNSDDLAYAMAMDDSGNVIVTGYSVGSGPFYDYVTIKYSGAGEVLWTNRYNGPGNSDDEAFAVAVDSSGNMFVTGSSRGIGSSNDFATIKYSGAGMPLWTNRYDGPGNKDDYAYALAVDGSGNVFVTGASTGTNGFRGYATIKYSGAGVALWTNRYHGPWNGDDGALAVTMDASGNLFVTGSSLASSGSYGYATIKYSGAGVALWTNRYDSGYATDIAADASGNVFVTSYSLGNAFCDDDGCIYKYDYATVAYSGAGVLLWANRYDAYDEGYSDDYAVAVAVDGSGNVIVTGRSGGDGANDYATIKYSGAGIPFWTNRYNGPGNSDDSGSAVAVDVSGDVIVTGTSASTNVYSYNYDLATIKYSGTGVALWTNRYAGPGNTDDYARAVAVNSSDDVFVTVNLFDGTNHDVATIKYSSLPLLTIARTTTNTVAISWPSPSTGFTLQQNTNSIATVNWSNVLTTPTDNGTTKTVIVNPATGNRFYRLKNP